MQVRSVVTAALCALASLAALVLAFVPVWSLSQCATVDGRARHLARQVERLATERDLVVVGLPRSHPERSRGRLLFPFRPLFAVDADTLGVDLRSLPFERVLGVGELDLARLGLGEPDRVIDGVRAWSLPDPRRSVLALLDPDRVDVVDASGVRPCRAAHPGGGVACGREPWFFVGPRLQRLGGADRLCLWAHPPPGGATLRIGLRATDLAHAGDRLRVDVQFVDEVRADPAHPPVQVELRADDAVLAAVSCSNRDGRCPLEHALEADAVAPLAVTLSTVHNGRQLVCLGGGLLAAGEGAP